MKIKVLKPSMVEEEIEVLGATPKQARTIGAVVRSISGDILNRRNDDIRFSVNGQVWHLTLARE